MQTYGQDRVQTDRYTVHGQDMDTIFQSQSKQVQDTDHTWCGHAPGTVQTQFGHCPDMFQTYSDSFQTASDMFYLSDTVKTWSRNCLDSPWQLFGQCQDTFYKLS